MIGIIGAGNMGRTIALRMQEKVLVTDADSVKLRFAKKGRLPIAKDNIDLTKRSDIIILAVKPQQISEVLQEIRPFAKGKLIISIAAGVKSAFIEKILKQARVIRVMPNMPALVGKGITAVAVGSRSNKKDLKIARGIFLKLGEVVEVNERLMDAVTAISGSGPAYYFLLTDLLAKAGEGVGLRKDLAHRLAMAVFIGAAELSARSDLSMQDFIKRVASKGGTTEAALKIFGSKGLENIVKQAVRAARDCSRSLSGYALFEEVQGG